MSEERGSKRATIGFVAPAVVDLDWLMLHKQMSQNDVVNRAVQVYAFLEREAAKGKVLHLANEDGSASERVHVV